MRPTLIASLATLALACCAARAPGAPRSTTARDVRLTVEAVIDTPAAPHGVAFSEDGAIAYVACAAAGVIAVIDTAAMSVVAELSAGETPLDIHVAGDALVVSAFERGALLRRPAARMEQGRVILADLGGPSLFSPPTDDGRRFLALQREDAILELPSAALGGDSLIDPEGLRRWPVGPSPHPPDATADGTVVFVPVRGADEVVAIDTLNNRELGRVGVPDRPEGGALTEDEAHYIAACGAEDALAWINTATLEIDAVLREDVGPRPVSVTLLEGRGLALVNNAGGDTVSIVDLEARRVVGAFEAAAQPVVVRVAPGGERVFISCERANQVVVVRIEELPAPPGLTLPTRVALIGALHGAHFESDGFGVDVVRALLERHGAEELLLEIPPARVGEAVESNGEGGWSSRFPELSRAALPYAREREARVVGVSPWTGPLELHRARALDILRAERPDDWTAHTRELSTMRSRIEAMGGDDDPRLLHTRAYDEVVRQGFEIYRERFGEALGPAARDARQARRIALIERRLDAIEGEGRRLAIIVPATEKGAVRRALEERDDVQLVEVGALLDEIEMRASGAE